MPMAVVAISGNLGSDPEIHRTRTGEACSFTVAVNRKTGGEEYTDWYRCVSFYDKQIEIIEKYLKKGSKVTVTGRLIMAKWRDRDDIERTTPEIQINDFDLGGDPPGDRDRGDRRDARGSDRGRDDRGGGGRGGYDDRGSGRSEGRGPARDDRGPDRDHRDARGTGGRDDRGRADRGRDDRGRDNRRDDRGRDDRTSSRAPPDDPLEDEIPF